ncbi:ACT domain-containing protein, partial [Thermodesulfobacteriota bacterium]
PRNQTAAIRRAFSRHLGTTIARRHPRVSALFIHGPHFGDRYGIVHTLRAALENAGIALLAMGCTVSSISVVISDKDLAKAVEALDATFQKSSGE